jgi:hypothetical protein
MLAEVMTFGRLLNTEALRKGGVLQAAITVTDDNFLASDATKRPPAWQAVRLRRAVIKEDQLRREGADEVIILQSRTNRVLQVSVKIYIVC